MKYIIYELVQPEHLQTTIYRDFHRKTIYRDVFQELDVYGIETIHSSMEEAVSEINNNKLKLKHLKLTIMPIFDINWEGEIR